MTELGHRLDGRRPGDIAADAPPGPVDRAELMRARQLVLGRLSRPDADDLTVQLAQVLAGVPGPMDPDGANRAPVDPASDDPDYEYDEYDDEYDDGYAAAADAYRDPDDTDRDRPSYPSDRYSGAAAGHGPDAADEPDVQNGRPELDYRPNLEHVDALDDRYDPADLSPLADAYWNRTERADVPDRDEGEHGGEQDGDQEGCDQQGCDQQSGDAGQPDEPLTDPFLYRLPDSITAPLLDVVPGGDTPADCPTRLLPALRDAVFGRRMTPIGITEPELLLGADVMPLPVAPTLVFDRAGRILRANPALLRLAGRDTDAFGGIADGVSGMQLSQLVLGPDDDARLLRPDGSRVRVRVVRWELPVPDQSAALLIELGATGEPAVAGCSADARWTAELERLQRAGRWSYELATGRLCRSDTLEELYRSIGIDAYAVDSRAPEREQVALLCQGMRFGEGPRKHHVHVPLPGAGALSCRAEVESAPDGTPLRIVGLVRDLSPEQVAQRRLGHSGQRFADLMDMVPGGVALLDPAGRLVDANPGLCELLDLPLERLRGVPAAIMCADSDTPYPDALGPIESGPTTLPEWLREVPPGARHSYRVDDVALRRSDGTPVWCELAVSATSVDDGGWCWLVVCTDISERRRAAELLRSAGSVDVLTRLPNRAAAVELVDRLLAGPGRDRVAVVCGDIDDFARVNSSLGHEAGDDLLVSLAGRLQRELPVSCTAARLSGDEFVVVCSDHAEVGGPDLLARTVADLLRTTIAVFGRSVQLTASVGLARPAPSGDVRAADLLRFAEAAMHDAKRRQCRGGIGIATDGVVNSAVHALELEAELRAAIASNGLVLDYQPVVGPDGTVLSAEALVRWPHPVRGMIPPGEFLPVAQRSGLLRELDLWVLRTATREAAAWPEHHGRRPSVAVNLAGLLPADVDFLPVISDILADGGLPPDRLVLELVETSLVALPAYARAAMAELTDRGVRFAVDDFGTGYSSLGRLKELPAQTVKVDRAFVTDVADDPVDFAVARAVVDMARAMGRTTVAEGVETADQFHRLRGIGVDAYQGWLFSKAVPAAELRQLLAGDRMVTPENVLNGL
ncbi:MAG TPA: EAL domain-containing protein [Pseudonocardia sp.]|nr:EAL domain-containing protein [Pseudonocardia sp.]